MSKFKVGDRVRIRNCPCGSKDCSNGKEFTITGCYDDPVDPKYDSDQNLGRWSENHLELVTSNKNNMSIKEKFIAAFLSEPEKTFRQKGITNGDGLLTEDGQTIMLSYLLKKFGAEFKTEVVDKLEEDKE